MQWRDPDSHETLGANLVDGKAVRFSLGSVAPIIVWDRTPWYQDSAWLLPLTYLGIAVLFLTTVLWPVRALIRRKYGASLGLEGRELKAYRASRIAATAVLLTLVAWMVMISTMFGDLNYLSASFLPVVLTVQVITFFAFIGGFLATLWYAVTVWRRKGGWKATWKAKTWSLLLVVATATILWIGLIYHLIGFATKY
jgi:hypothetical protein